MTEYERHRVQETNSEVIPLTNISDYGQESLPPDYDDPHCQYLEPETQMRAEGTRPAYTALASKKTTADQRRRFYRNKACLVSMACGCVFLPGFAFLIAGLLLYQFLAPAGLTI